MGDQAQPAVLVRSRHRRGKLGHHSGVGVGAGTSISPPPHGEYLKLTFDKDGKLNAWNKIKH